MVLPSLTCCTRSRHSYYGTCLNLSPRSYLTVLSIKSRLPHKPTLPPIYLIPSTLRDLSWFMLPRSVQKKVSLKLQAMLRRLLNIYHFTSPPLPIYACVCCFSRGYFQRNCCEPALWLKEKNPSRITVVGASQSGTSWSIDFSRSFARARANWAQFLGGSIEKIIWLTPTYPIMWCLGVDLFVYILNSTNVCLFSFSSCVVTPRAVISFRQTISFPLFELMRRKTQGKYSYLLLSPWNKKNTSKNCQLCRIR